MLANVLTHAVVPKGPRQAATVTLDTVALFTSDSVPLLQRCGHKTNGSADSIRKHCAASILNCCRCASRNENCHKIVSPS